MDRECGYKAFCHSGAKDPNDRVCMHDGTLANGESLGPINLPQRCASAQTVNVAEWDEPDNWICTKGKVSQYGYGRDAVFDYPADCLYQEYTTSEVESVTMSSPALCGFNVQSHYYCPV